MISMADYDNPLLVYREDNQHTASLWIDRGCIEVWRNTQDGKWHCGGDLQFRNFAYVHHHPTRTGFRNAYRIARLLLEAHRRRPAVIEESDLVDIIRVEMPDSGEPIAVVRTTRAQQLLQHAEQLLTDREVA